jgi:hypothetical protein
MRLVKSLAVATVVAGALGSYFIVSAQGGRRRRT